MSECKYAFLTTLIPDNLIECVATLSKNNMQDAANALQWHIYNGLCANLEAEVKLFNILPIGSFPQYYSAPFLKRSLFDTAYSKKNINIGFCNVKLIRKYILPHMVYTELNRWCKANTGKKILFVYTASPQLLTAAQKIKNRYKDIKIIDIIADLPNMSSLTSNKSAIQRIFERSQSETAFNRLQCVDAYVLLTKYMADYLKIKQPYCVVEGISSVDKPYMPYHSKKEKIILYTGTLHKKFGILTLLEAFSLINDSDYRLYICGIGDSEQEIRNAAKKDSRIKFFGQVSREKAMELQAGASVLVNPRQNTEEYTKYSFPSKNLEYLSSGRPLVAYKLDGIPDEYDDLIYYVKDNAVQTLADKLTEVCSITEENVNRHCLSAYNYVKENKNEVVQMRRVCKFIEVLKW